MVNENVCRPDLRRPGDPPLGVFAPIKTQFFYRVRVGQSALHARMGRGLFSEEPVVKEAVLYIGGGQLTSDPSAAPPDKDYVGVFDEGLFIAPLDYEAPSGNWFINHACEPNLKVVGRLVLVAKRDIASGEELTIDYATVAAGEAAFRMECLCGSKQCRKIISGSDWMNGELFDRCYGEWPPSIQKKRGSGVI